MMLQDLNQEANFNKQESLKCEIVKFIDLLELHAPSYKLKQLHKLFPFT